MLGFAGECRLQLDDSGPACNTCWCPPDLPLSLTAAPRRPRLLRRHHRPAILRNGGVAAPVRVHCVWQCHQPQASFHALEQMRVTALCGAEPPAVKPTDLPPPPLLPRSARLMVRARDHGAGLYCDATTQQLAKHKARMRPRCYVQARQATHADTSCPPTPAPQAVYCPLEPVRVKGRTQPVDIFEVTSLHAEAAAAGRRPGLSPLGPHLLGQAPPLAEAAVAAVSTRLGRSGSGAVPGASAGGGGILDVLAQTQEAAAQQGGLGGSMLSLEPPAVAHGGAAPPSPMIGEPCLALLLAPSPAHGSAALCSSTAPSTSRWRRVLPTCSARR